MLSIFCMPDHLHFLAGVQPSIAVSDLVRDVKAAPQILLTAAMDQGQFNWQDSFGAFSYSRSQIDNVIKYI